ncbi:MAG TPA: hypothetical protein DEP84_31585 [Chloroflexi bacterium]|nr:hypothetical protein [Chloroflexota bacterium]
MLIQFLFTLIAVSWIYWLVAWWLVHTFFTAAPEPDQDFTPPVSILKPVKGLDVQAYQNFASFCQQDYPDFELLFGVSDPDDPVIAVVERLQRDFPHRSIRLSVSPATQVNRKASLLHSLTAKARHEVLVVSDSDMRVTRDYLRRVVAPLADEGVGLVTCPYRGERPVTLTAKLEALYMGVTFLPSVLVARKVLSMRFALGATIAVRRRDLARLGGFAAVAEYLADDYQLGARMARLGRRVHLSNYVVTCVLGATTFREQWDREVRWAQCTRVSRPFEFPGMLLTFSTPLAVILGLLTGFAPLASLSLAISVLLRWLVAWSITGDTANQVVRRWLFWLPVRDMLSALVWCAGAAGRHVVWRGERFRLRSDGRLEPLPSGGRQVREEGYPVVLARTVRGVDALLRRYYHIYEFSHDEDCLFRLAIGKSDRDLTLSDGTPVCRGERVGELHLWNERIPPVPTTGPDLAWGRTIQRRMRRSLGELAAYVESAPQFQGIQAFRGEMAFESRDGRVQMAHVVEHWGFHLADRDLGGGPWQRFTEFWENIYTLVLIWVFNRGSLKGKSPRNLKRYRFWISREALIRRYRKERPSDLTESHVEREGAPATVDLHSHRGQAAPQES